MLAWSCSIIGLCGFKFIWFIGITSRSNPQFWPVIASNGLILLKVFISILLSVSNHEYHPGSLPFAISIFIVIIISISTTFLYWKWLYSSYGRPILQIIHVLSHYYQLYPSLQSCSATVQALLAQIFTFHGSIQAFPFSILQSITQMFEKSFYFDQTKTWVLYLFYPSCIWLFMTLSSKSDLRGTDNTSALPPYPWKFGLSLHNEWMPVQNIRVNLKTKLRPALEESINQVTLRFMMCIFQMQPDNVYDSSPQHIQSAFSRTVLPTSYLNFSIFSRIVPQSREFYYEFCAIHSHCIFSWIFSIHGSGIMGCTKDSVIHEEAVFLLAKYRL